MQTLRRHDDWKRGIHPVSIGRAPFLTDVFLQSMHLCDEVRGGG